MVLTESGRLRRLAAEIEARGWDAFIAWSPITMGYLCGFFEGGGERFMALCVRKSGEVRLICPALSASQAERVGIRDIRPWKDGEDPLTHFTQLASDWNLKSGIVGVDDEMPALMLLPMQRAAPAALFLPGSDAISRLMRVKDEAEIAAMRQAARIADGAIPKALGALREGVSELEVQEQIEMEMRRLGGRPSFCIVAAGQNGAEPHHLSDETRLKRGDVVVLDFGCSVSGYQSDITRTASLGDASEEARKVYAIVYEAQSRAREAIRPGIEAQEVDRVARTVIEDAGYGERFMHRLGHGIGLRGHEEPNLVAGNTHRLEPGNCFSVEPGIYLPGEFGVRIENIVTVTRDGHESLNEEPASRLIEL